MKVDIRKKEKENAFVEMGWEDILTIRIKGEKSGSFVVVPNFGNCGFDVGFLKEGEEINNMRLKTIKRQLN